MRQRGRFTAILRVIPSDLLTFDQIGLPEARFKQPPHGGRAVSFLVTGPTGSGKSTTLATMIDWINQSLDRHIITIEDPIEFYHTHGRGLVTQRELGERRTGRSPRRCDVRCVRTRTSSCSARCGTSIRSRRR